MKSVWTMKRSLFLTTTVVLCGLNQLTPAQTPVSIQTKARLDPVSVQQSPALDNPINSMREKPQRLTSNNSNDYVDSYNLSKTYARAGDYYHAIDLLKKVIETNPESAAAYNELGVLYCELHQLDKAIDTFNAGMRYESSNSALTANLGTANYLLGNYDRAIELLKDAVKQDPTLDVAQSNLGQILLRVGRYKEALECLSRVVPAQRGNYEAQLYNDIGVAHSYLKHFKEAVDCFRRAIETDATFSQARFNLGVVGLTIKDRATAYDQYVALKSLDQSLAEKLYARIYRSRILPAKPDSHASGGN